MVQTMRCTNANAWPDFSLSLSDAILYRTFLERKTFRARTFYYKSHYPFVTGRSERLTGMLPHMSSSKTDLSALKNLKGLTARINSRKWLIGTSPIPVRPGTLGTWCVTRYGVCRWSRGRRLVTLPCGSGLPEKGALSDRTLGAVDVREGEEFLPKVPGSILEKIFRRIVQE